MMSEIRDINSILFSFGENDHYQSSRVMDDFFVPKKHNFHPNDVIPILNYLERKYSILMFNLETIIMRDQIIFL